MTPAELRACRQTLGLSARAFGALLGLGGDPGRSIRRYEAGTRPIPGPIERLARWLAYGERPAAETRAKIA